jgi:hypothetical protein
MYAHSVPNSENAWLIDRGGHSWATASTSLPIAIAADSGPCSMPFVGTSDASSDGFGSVPNVERRLRYGHVSEKSSTRSFNALAADVDGAPLVRIEPHDRLTRARIGLGPSPDLVLGPIFCDAPETTPSNEMCKVVIVELLSADLKSKRI